VGPPYANHCPPLQIPVSPRHRQFATIGRDGEPRERLVVLHKDHRRVIDRIPEYGRAFEHLGLAAQVLPWTRAELATRLAEREPFATEIVRTGKVLAGTLDRLGDAERGKGEG